MIRSSKWSLGGQNTLARIPKMEPWRVFVHRPMIQLRISFKEKSRIQIRIRNEVKSWIQLRIKGLQIRNPGKSSVCLMLMSLWRYLCLQSQWCRSKKVWNKWRIQRGLKNTSIKKSRRCILGYIVRQDTERESGPRHSLFPGCARRGNRDRIHEEAQSTYCITVYCMSPRRNWDTPTPSPTNEWAPTPQSKEEGHTRLRVRGWRSLKSDDWRKSLALCLLWSRP